MSGSGWVDVLTDAGLSTPGTAESFLTAAHMRRFRHMHEVTLASLYVLQRQAFTTYMSGTDQTEVMSFEAWCSLSSMAHSAVIVDQPINIVLKITTIDEHSLPVTTQRYGEPSIFARLTTKALHSPNKWSTVSSSS